MLKKSTLLFFSILVLLFISLSDQGYGDHKPGHKKPPGGGGGGGGSGDDPTFTVQLVQGDLMLVASPDRMVCANDSGYFDLVEGVDGFASVPDNDSQVVVRFNTIGPGRTFLNITWPGRDGVCGNGDDFEAFRGSLHFNRDQNGITDFIVFFKDQNSRKQANIGFLLLGACLDFPDANCVRNADDTAGIDDLNKHIQNCDVGDDCFKIHLDLDTVDVRQQGNGRLLGTASLGDLVFTREE